MVRYETLVLAVPEITGDESKLIEKELTSVIEKSKGSLISFERWGKYRLAYPVKKNEYGIYFLVRFETEHASSLPKEVGTVCKVKLNSVVMRDMTSRLANDTSLVYQRPPSLEDAPTRDVRTFLRENKMEGLLSTVDDNQRASDDRPSDDSADTEKDMTQEAQVPQDSLDGEE